MTPHESHKVQFRFSEKAIAELDVLQQTIGAPSRAETIRYALRWLQWTVDRVAGQGHMLCIDTGDGVPREVVIPFLPQRTRRDTERS